MTDPQRQLDPSLFFSGRPLTLYRLARARYANLSGIGAALQPGRWNVPGQEAIYTSTEIAVPVLERLVHTPKDMIPSNLAMMTLQVAGEWLPLDEQIEEILLDRNTQGEFLFFKSLRRAYSEESGAIWTLQEGLRPFAIAVPSVIVPAWNVVLYPQANGFWNHVKLVSVEPFAFDPRLFSENATAEPTT